MAVPSTPGNAVIPGLDLNRLGSVKEEPQQQPDTGSGRDRPFSTTNKDTKSGRGSFRSLISPTAERAHNALAQRYKQGISGSVVGSDMGGDGTDRDE